MPKVSVIISAYNTEQYVGEAIESILAQTMGDFELLIVDDGSTDRTLDVINGYSDLRIRVFSQENSGKAVAVNRLLDVATGEFVTLQDADDRAAPERLEKLVGEFRKQPDLGMVFSGYALILDGKVRAPRRSSGDVECCKRAIDNYLLPGLDPTMMVRADIAKATRFDPSLRIGQGFDFILKVGERHPIILIPDILYYYRFHYQSITKADPARKGRYLLQIVNNARQRRGVPPMAEEVFLDHIRDYMNDVNNNLSAHFTDAAYFSIVHGYRVEALKTALLSLTYAPRGGLKYVKSLVYAMLPVGLAKSLRRGH